MRLFQIQKTEYANDILSERKFSLIAKEDTYLSSRSWNQKTIYHVSNCLSTLTKLYNIDPNSVNYQLLYLWNFKNCFERLRCYLTPLHYFDKITTTTTIFSYSYMLEIALLLHQIFKIKILIDLHVLKFS